MRVLPVSVLMCLVVILSCGQKAERKGSHAVGRVTMRDIYRDFPRFRQNADAYEPDAGMVQRLKSVDRRITVKVFLGTWCSDSEEHVPVFDVLFEAVDNPSFTIEYYGVDRKKDDGLGLAERFHIAYVPTFVLLEDGEEIGRIVETPSVSMADDVLNILRGGD